MTSNFIGLDFGTSNSVASYLENKSITLLPLETDKSTIPSVIFFDYEDGCNKFGSEAIQDYILGVEGRLLRSLKSLLGSSLIEESTIVRNKPIKFTDIISLFLEHIKNKVEKKAKNHVTNVVVGRPVFFVDNNAEADQLAQNQLHKILMNIGFKNVEFQYEPIAAALSYENSLSSEELTLIVDIGGGTSDFSVVRLSPKRHLAKNRSKDILANSGIHIGGTNLDSQIHLDNVCPHFGYNSIMKEKNIPAPTSYFFNLSSWHRVQFLYDKKLLAELRLLVPRIKEDHLFQRLYSLLSKRMGHKLLFEVEQAKIELISNTTPLYIIKFKLDGEIIEIPISLDEIVQSISDNIRKITDNIIEVIALANVDKNEISSIFLTGGSTLLPDFKNRLRHIFNNHVKIIQGDAFSSVGFGLGLHANTLFNR
jgi:hypothetical chaperone protein